MTKNLTLFISAIVLFFHSFLMSANISPSTYIEKVRSELHDNFKIFIQEAKDPAQSIIDELNGLSENESLENKENLNDAVVFLKTGNLSCAINFLRKKFNGLNHNGYQSLIKNLCSLEKHSYPLEIKFSDDPHRPNYIGIDCLISKDQLIIMHAKNMISAHFQSEEPSFMSSSYALQSPANLCYLDIAATSDHERAFPNLTNKPEALIFVASIKTSISDLFIHTEEFNGVVDYDGKKFIIWPSTYLLYKAISPHISVKSLLESITPNMGLEEITAKKNDLITILSYNISEAEKKYPTQFIISEKQLENIITERLKSMLSANDGKLAQLFDPENWHNTQLIIPLSNFHARENNSLTLNFYLILKLALSKCTTNSRTISSPVNLDRFSSDAAKDDAIRFIRICEENEVCATLAEKTTLQNARYFLQFVSIEKTKNYLDENKEKIGDYLYNYLSHVLNLINLSENKL